jgi:hypothetical protein
MLAVELALEVNRQALRILKRLRTPSARGVAIAEYANLDDVAAADRALKAHLQTRGPKLNLP